MARLARVVATGYPHHVTQRGNRRQQVFFREEDFQAYLALLAEWCGRESVEVWSYCLMPNHVHLMVVPQSAQGLARAVGEVHRRYTRLVNFRENWRGYLWQGRFASFPMERTHALACARYIELNPVRAGLAAKPDEWRWSSAGAHLRGETGPLIRSSRPLGSPQEWVSLLGGSLEEAEGELIRCRERTGRPLGSDRFIERLEASLGRPLKPQKPGRKRKEEAK